MPLNEHVLSEVISHLETSTRCGFCMSLWLCLPLAYFGSRTQVVPKRWLFCFALSRRRSCPDCVVPPAVLQVNASTPHASNGWMGLDEILWHVLEPGDALSPQACSVSSFRCGYTFNHCVGAKNCKNGEITAGIQARAGSFLPDIRRGNGRAARDQHYRSTIFQSFHLAANFCSEVTELIGSGSYGSVCEAVDDHKGQRHIKLKVERAQPHHVTLAVYWGTQTVLFHSPGSDMQH